MPMHISLHFWKTEICSKKKLKPSSVFSKEKEVQRLLPRSSIAIAWCLNLPISTPMITIRSTPKKIRQRTNPLYTDNCILVRYARTKSYPANTQIFVRTEAIHYMRSTKPKGTNIDLCLTILYHAGNACWYTSARLLLNWNSLIYNTYSQFVFIAMARSSFLCNARSIYGYFDGYIIYEGTTSVLFRNSFAVGIIWHLQFSIYNLP